MFKIHNHTNKSLIILDVVNLVSNRFDKNLLKGLDDYRIILTHGVIGELIFLIENDCFGLDKSKIILCCNNVQTTSFFIQNGFVAHTISEYIFSDDDLYQIDYKSEKEYDCIFPGRPAKKHGLFLNKYKNNILTLCNLPNYPIHRKEVVSYYNKSKCGLMTTESEGSCLSVGEMLLCGLPIISVKIAKSEQNLYYPINKKSYESTYDLVLPNTLGGRELWLDSNNSIICNRNDNSIDNSISSLLEKKYDSSKIRNDFLAKLFKERINFLFLLKYICDDLSISFNESLLCNITNLPYGNSTIDSTEWKLVIKYFFEVNNYN